MIKISLWDNKCDSWEKELINNPKYQLKTVIGLKGYDSIKGCENLEENKRDECIIDLCRLKKFIISDIPGCLGNESLTIYIILGANPKIGLDLDSVPGYIKNDECLLEDCWNFIKEEVLDLFSSEDNIKDLYESADFKILEKLTKFPKDFNKRESYYYEWGGISSAHIIKDNPGNDYWSSFSLFYKISVFGKEFLIDVKHSSGGNRVMVYSYDTKSQVSSKINQKIIVELFNYHLWKI